MAGAVDDAAGYPHRNALSRRKQGAMGQFIPPLTTAELAEAHEIERKMLIALEFSRHDMTVFLEQLIAHAVELFELYERVFAKGAISKTQPREQASARAVYRVTKRLVDSRLVNETVGTTFIRIIETKLAELVEHLSSLEPRLFLPPIVAPATAAFPIPIIHSSSKTSLVPLLPNRKASTRQAFVQPLLDQKGWDIAAWAKKAKVSRHTAKTYLDASRKTYHATMKDLAEALGVSFQDFPK